MERRTGVRPRVGRRRTVGGVGFEGTVRDGTHVANAWGTRGGNLFRAILNAVIPVSIVETIFDDASGSVYGLTANAPGIINHRPSVSFVSLTESWELHAINCYFKLVLQPPAASQNYNQSLSLFTALQGYDPLAVAPSIEFGPQLVTARQFEQGTVRGQGGHNLANYPFGVGWMLMQDTFHTQPVGGGGSAGGRSQSPLPELSGRSAPAGVGQEAVQLDDLPPTNPFA